MSVKVELHELVDQLDDRNTLTALAYLRQLLAEGDAASDTARARLARRMGSGIVAGSSFFAQAPLDLPTIAAAQGVQPVRSLDDLPCVDWPDDESIDDFVASVRAWRHEGGHA